MERLVLLQTVAPDYRGKLFSHILQSLGQKHFDVYAGDYYFESTVKTDQSIPYIKRVRNNYFFKRKLLFQTGMWYEILKNNTLVIELNPRIVSNWIILIIRKVLFRKTILWGHAWPRNGKNSSTDVVRNLMRKLASGILVYTHTQKKELQDKMPSKKVFCAPNSLLFNNEMKTHYDASLINNIIYVGRLTELKKPMVLLKAFHNILRNLPKNTKLIFVGEGEQKQRIIKYLNENSINENVCVLGHVSEYNKLKTLYDSSLLSVSPGYIGLSVTQSFSFGVPMIVSSNENHSPEIEAVKPNLNSLYFETDDIEDLSDKILSIYMNKINWVAKRKDILEFCLKEYSIENMAQSFLDLNKS